MPKPKRIPRGFRKAIQRNLQHYRGLPKEKFIAAVYGEIQDYLIEKMRLPPNVEKKVKRHEAHTVRLNACMWDTMNGLPIAVETLRAYPDSLNMGLLFTV